MIDNFCALILTHGRPDRVYTYDMLRKCGYTGPIYIVIDNEDKTAQKYRDKYGDQVVMFDKVAIAKTFDEGDNFNDRRAIIYARNASFQIAKDLGFRHFIQLDDDYTGFRYDNVNGKTRDYVKSLDSILMAYLEFLKESRITSVAMAQDGDFIGGSDASGFFVSLRRRKCMNSFICDTENSFTFVGRINEDVNTYTYVQSTGRVVFITIPLVSIRQMVTQTNKGGMSDLYLASGTYVKSFYTVMYAPSTCTVTDMGSSHRRLHHRISWKNAVPQIIEERFKK